MGKFQVGDKVIITDFDGVPYDDFMKKHHQQGYVTIDGIRECANERKARTYCPACDRTQYSFIEHRSPEGNMSYWCAMGHVIEHFNIHISKPKKFKLRTHGNI